MQVDVQITNGCLVAGADARPGARLVVDRATARDLVVAGKAIILGGDPPRGAVTTESLKPTADREIKETATAKRNKRTEC